MAKVLDTRPGSPTLGLMIDEALLKQPVAPTTPTAPTAPAAPSSSGGQYVQTVINGKPSLAWQETIKTTSDPWATEIRAGGVPITSESDTALAQSLGYKVVPTGDGAIRIYPKDTTTSIEKYKDDLGILSNVFRAGNSTIEPDWIYITKGTQNGYVPPDMIKKWSDLGWTITNQTALQNNALDPSKLTTQIQSQTQPTVSNLTFKAGLTDTQKTQLQNRLNAIKGGSAITQTDINNFNYALGTTWQGYLGVTGTDQTAINNQLKATTPQAPAQTEPTFQMDYSNLPSEILNSEDWKNASDQNKMMTSIMYNMQQGIAQGDVALMQDMQDALNKAMAVADPYFRQKIALVQDKVLRSVGKTEGDYASNLKTYQDKIRQIDEDLTFNKEYLSLEQQQDLANQKRQYENQLYSTQQQMAEAGLAFSSPRARAEEELRAQNQGTVESLTRQYNKAMREQQLGSERQTTALQQNVADLERAKKEGLTDISRQGEAQLGSAKLPTIPGVTPLGGTTGSIDYEKQTTIPSLAQTYVDWTKVL